MAWTALFASGCAHYEYDIVAPPELARHVGGAQDEVIRADPLEYRLRSYENRLVLNVFNPTGDAETARPGQPVKSTAWIFAPWLLTPPLAPLRADPRFKTLCDGIGLTDYWTSRGIRPDYRIGTP